MDKKKISYLILLCLFSLSCTLQAEKYETVSPNGKLKIKLKIDKGTQYEVWYDNTQLILPSPIGLHLADGRVIGNGSVKSAKKRLSTSLLVKTKNYRMLIMNLPFLSMTVATL